MEKKFVKIVLLLSFVSIVFSCRNENKNNLSEQNNDTEQNLVKKSISWKNFGVCDTLKLSKISELDIGMSAQMKLLDSLIFFVSTYNSEYLLNITNLEGKIINKCIRKGRGPNEMTYIFFIGFLKKKGLMYAYDGYMDNILYYFKIRDVISQKAPKIKKDIELGQGLSHIESFISENKFIARCDTAEYKLLLIDSAKNILKKIGKYNIHSTNESSNYYINTAYMKRIITNTHKNKIALFYVNMDLFEIFNFSGQQLLAEKGPDNIDLYNFKPQDAKNMQGYRLTDNKSYWAYNYAVSKSKYIYALYNGNKVEGKSFFSNRKLLVFDWNGKPIKYYYLSKPISTFDIDTTTSTLYGYDTDNGNLYKAKLNLPE